MSTSTARTAGRVAIVAGPIVAIVVAWVTESAKGDMSIANVALVLGLVAVVAALLDPIAGFVTSAVAGLSLNYFHTVPVHSLRMSDGEEIVTVLLLVALGATVSIATTLRVRRSVGERRAGAAQAAARELAEALDDGQPLPTSWKSAIDAVTDTTAALAVRRVSRPPADVPLVRRPAAGDTDDTLVVPEAGAVVSLADGSALVLTPQQGLGSVTCSRAQLVRFADDVAEALARAN